MEEMANRLLALRKDKGVTQEEVGKALGVSAQSVSKWETGNALPDIGLLPGLAAYYQVSIDFLFGREEARKETNKNPKIHIQVDESGKENVDINLPYQLVKILFRRGMHLGNEKTDSFLDIEQLQTAVESGITGRIIEVKDADGTIVTIDVE